MTQRSSPLRLGFVGLGHRAQQFIREQLDGDARASVHALYDRDRARVAAFVAGYEEAQRPQICASIDELLDAGIDALFVFTMWESHVDFCVRAMRRGIPAACEVGAAYSLMELEELVRVHEETGVDVHYLENGCYGRDELLLLSLVRSGALGQIQHAEGLYLNDGRRAYSGEVQAMGGFRELRLRDADLYPSHVLGPLAVLLDINRGARILSVSSSSTSALGIGDYLAAQGLDDPQPHRGGQALGDHILTVLRLSSGATIALSSSMTLPGDYQRSLTLRGTRGYYDGRSREVVLVAPNQSLSRYSLDDPAFRKQYEHPLWREETRGDFRGMDGQLVSAVLERLAKRDAPAIDVYDMASWRALTVLSEQSILSGGSPQMMPDFTRGRWMTRTAWTP